MSEYFLSVCGATLLSALLTQILPSGKTNKFLIGILKLCCLAVFVAPVASWLRQFPQTEPSDLQIELDSSYLDHCDELVSQDVATAIEQDAEERFSVVCRVRVEVFRSELRRIFFSLQGMNDSAAHINTIDRIKAYLENKYGVEACYETSL